MALKTCTGTTSRPYVHVQVRLSQAATVSATGADAPLLQDFTGASDGTYSLSLQANGDLTPANTYYTVTEFLGTTDNSFTIQVPTSVGPFLVTNILVSPPPAASALVALDAQVVHLANPETITGVKHGSAAWFFDAGATTTSLALSGLPGATQASRFVGATVFGPPTSGTFQVGDQVASTSGTQWTCITAGSPGTWISTSTVFNVKDYGAKGDGVTDDAAAINAAVTAANAMGGGTVFLPDGIYIIKSTINITGAHNIRLLGVGTQTILRPAAPFTGTSLITINQNTCILDSFSIIPGNATYTNNPAIDCITIQGPASGTVLQNLFAYYYNGWFVNAIPNGATGWFGIDMKTLYAQSGKQGIHLSASGVSGNGGAVFMANIWMDHCKAGDAFFLEDVHDITCSNSFAVVDTGGATGSCVHIKGACAGIYFTNTDHGGGAGYTGDAILVERNAALTVPILICFTNGVTVIQGRGLNLYANDVQFIGFTFLSSQTDGVIINGGARISFTSCSWQSSNLSSGTAYDVNNQITNFVHLTDCWFNSALVTASLNGIAGAQWRAVGCHATTGQPLTAGIAPLFLNQAVASGTSPVSTIDGGINIPTAALGLNNTGGDLAINAKAASNILFQVGGSTQAFLGNSGILNTVPNGGLDASSAGTLKVGPNNTNLINVGKAGVLTAHLGETSAVNYRHATQNVAFNAAPTPDPTLGEMYVMNSLTGAVNVGNPVNAVQGQRLRMYWKQDGTGGRVVTYTGANWRSVGIAAQVTTLNTMTIDEAECVDGTVWRVVRLVTGQTV